MPFRNTASFGKRREFIAMAELLKRGFDVYATLVDDQGRSGTPKFEQFSRYRGDNGFELLRAWSPAPRNPELQRRAPRRSLGRRRSTSSSESDSVNDPRHQQ